MRERVQAGDRALEAEREKVQARDRVLEAEREKARERERALETERELATSLQDTVNGLTIDKKVMQRTLNILERRGRAPRETAQEQGSSGPQAELERERARRAEAERAWGQERIGMQTDRDRLEKELAALRAAYDAGTEKPVDRGPCKFCNVIVTSMEPRGRETAGLLRYFHVKCIAVENKRLSDELSDLRRRAQGGDAVDGTQHV